MSCGNGEVKCYYDPQRSQRGMALCMIKPAKRKTGSEFFSTQQILNRMCLILLFEIYFSLMFSTFSSRFTIIQAG